MTNNDIFQKSVRLLSVQQSMRIIFNTLEGNYALCLLANLLELAYYERETSMKKLAFPYFTVSTFINL